MNAHMKKFRANKEDLEAEQDMLREIGSPNVWQTVRVDLTRFNSRFPWNSCKHSLTDSCTEAPLLQILCRSKDIQRPPTR